MSRNLLLFATLLLTLPLFAAPPSSLAPAIGLALFDGPTQNTISTTNDQGSATTFTIDETCQTILLQLTSPDPSGNGTDFESYSLNPRDASGSRVTDFTGVVNLSFRVRSAEAVELTTQFNSGGGSSSERTDRLSQTIPGDLSAWTEVTFTFDPANYEVDFDESDIRRISMWLDRGSNVFAGNEFYIDNIFFGGDIDNATDSPCPLDGSAPPLSEHYLQPGDHGGDPLLGNTSASGKSTLTTDATCETLQISVTDPDGNAVGNFQPYAHRPRDAGGTSIPDVTDNVIVTFNVWSAEATNFGALFRDDDDDRTGRKEMMIPAGGTEWTTVTFAWTAAELGDFDPDKMDVVWFYLDPGALNFPGNNFFIDDIVVGGAPDASKVSPCPLPPATLPVTWVDFSGTFDAKGTADLFWSTAAEEGASHFEVEYGVDGATFRSIGTLPAKGDTDQLAEYTFAHPCPVAGRHYFRLRQVDLDGAFSYSDVLALDGGKETLRLYPNPATTELTVSAVNGTPYSVVNHLGREVLAGTLSGAISVAELPTGQYYLRVGGVAYRFLKR